MDKKFRVNSDTLFNAFELFNRGCAAFQVSESLGITISEARNYYNLFLKGEEMSPEQEQENTEFLINGLKKREIEDSLNVLSGDLSLMKKKMEFVKLVDDCIDKTRSFAPEAGEVLVFCGSFNQMFHWMKNSGESRLIDIIRNMCDN